MKFAKPHICVEVEVNPTEDPIKVKMAVENIFGGIGFETETQRQRILLTAKATGRDALSKFCNLLRRERIRDAARGAFFEGLNTESVVFYLNKQVAYAGHISFSKPEAESALGPIKVKIQYDNPRELVEWLAPRTA